MNDANAEVPQVFREFPWMVAKVDQLIARFRARSAFEYANQVQAEIVMCTLTEPASPEERDKWERSCDRCGTYTPNGENFYTGHIFREVEQDGQTRKLLITFGVCQGCRFGG